MEGCCYHLINTSTVDFEGVIVVKLMFDIKALGSGSEILIAVG